MYPKPHTPPGPEIFLLQCVELNEWRGGEIHRSVGTAPDHVRIVVGDYYGGSKKVKRKKAQQHWNGVQFVLLANHATLDVIAGSCMTMVVRPEALLFVLEDDGRDAIWVQEDQQIAMKWLEPSL